MSLTFRPSAFLSILLLVSGCNSTENMATHDDELKDDHTMTLPENASQIIKQHKWILDEVNQSKLTKNKAYFSIDEAMQVSGYAGCNRFRGLGEIAEGRLVVKKFVMTRMACISDEVTAIENKIRTNFAVGMTVQDITETQLLMQGEDQFRFVTQ